jgi:hypothetical protein
VAVRRKARSARTTDVWDASSLFSNSNLLAWQRQSLSLLATGEVHHAEFHSD